MTAADGSKPLCFDICLKTAVRKRVGMDVILVSGNQYSAFVIDSVQEGGRLDRWNQSSEPPYQAQTGDCIVQVNGVDSSQTLSKMAEEFAQEHQEVNFTVLRGSP